MSNHPQVFKFPEVYVVEASAGSGKTYALAKRYVQLLLNPALKNDQVIIRNILAITFTNKAAFEMKVRILEFLRKVAFMRLLPEEEKDILGSIGLQREEASQKAYRIMDELIRNYNFFQVQTIDSFINALLSGCAFKIGLSAGFKIKTNAVDYLELSLDRLIDTAHTDPKTLRMFHDFLHQYIFTENRTGWFPKKDILILMQTLFSESTTFGYDFGDSLKKKNDLPQQKSRIIKLMQKLRDNLPAKTHAGFLKSLDAFLVKYSNHFSLDDISSYFMRDTVPVNKGAVVPPGAERLWEQIRMELKDLCEEESRTFFAYYVEVFNRVFHEFKALSGKDDVLFLAELNKEAKKLFDEEKVTVEELYYRLATRFRHYLIDEFQDTSLLQWQNFILMVEEALSTGGSLFYVGDKKQAIYGFRGGEVRLFDGIKERFEAFNVREEILSKNYRSQKNVVDFNNLLFSPENIQRFITEKEQAEEEKGKKLAIRFDEADVEDILLIFHGSRQTCRAENTQGYVKLERIDAQNKEEGDALIKEKVVPLIRDLRHRFTYREIAILVRSNKDVEMVTSWLLEAGIAVDSERTSNIKENFLIKELLSFLKFLSSPIDNLAFSSFILGDSFSAASGIPLDEIRKFIFELKERQRQQKDFYIYRAFRERYSKVWEDLIEEFFLNVGLYPLYELVLSILSRLNCLQNFPEYQGFIMRFLELIKDQEEESSDIESFLEFFEAAEGELLYVNVSDSDTVRILTVHKSKGLEFPVVVIPFLEMGVQAGSGGGQGEKTYVVDIKNDHLNLVHLKSKYLNFSPELEAIYKKEYKKSFLAELNNAYVALTRAKQELYVFVPRKAGNSINLVNYLIPGDAIIEQGQKVAYAVPAGKEAPQIQALAISQYQNWLHLLKDEFTDFQQVKERRRLRRGDVLHFVFSFIGNLTGEDSEKIVKAAIEEAGRVFPLENDMEELKKIIIDVLRQKHLRPFFFIEKGEVFQEKEVIDKFGHVKRIDRLIVEDDEAWVVDYKSSALDTNEYREQVAEYMKIIKELCAGKKVRGFLIYLDSFKLEEVHA